LQGQGKLEEACQCYQRAIELKPDLAEAHLGLASTRNEQGNSGDAIQHYLTAIQIKPDLTAAKCNLGIVLEEQGDFAGAEKYFRSAIASDFRHAAAHAELACLLHAALPAEDVAAQQQLLVDPGLTQEQRAALHFGLAEVFDARGAYAEAAEHANLANALRLTQWRTTGKADDPVAHSQFVDRILAEFTPEFFAGVRGFGVPNDRPVFIVGLPRSGTTLVEQILASHPRVFGAGELVLARDAYATIHGQEDSGGKLALDRDSVQRLAQQHLEALQRRNATALRIVDKMPDNYLYLGFLATLFPHARFIHCQRGLRDVAVSCWMTNFRAVRWASDPGHIAARFRDYQRLMEHWRRVLRVPILDVSYEETVTNLEAVARRLVAWCGLEWQPSCLEFHRGKRTVRTASSVQVRQPLYTTSVGRWKHYEQSLATLLSAIPSCPSSIAAT
jgi:tetratricopeptide (TPR) repeat protein